MAKLKIKRETKRKTAKVRKIKKISRLRQPENMPLEQWQIALRKQFAQKQQFRLRNIGKEPISLSLLSQIRKLVANIALQFAVRGLGIITVRVRILRSIPSEPANISSLHLPNYSENGEVKKPLKMVSNLSIQKSICVMVPGGK